MSLGTITITKVRETADGGQEILMSFLGDTSYPTGGTAGFNALVRAAIKAKHVAATDALVRGAEQVAVMAVVPQNCGQYIPSYDYTNDKLFVQDGGSATLAEVAGTTALNGTTFKVLVICT